MNYIFLFTDPQWAERKRTKMASTRGGKGKGSKISRNKERANMSFFIVIMFFAVFGIIVFTEIFLIDERGHGTGVVVRHGGGRHRNDKADYDDILQVKKTHFFF